MASCLQKSQPDSVSCNLNLDDSITTRQECSAEASAAPVGTHCMESQGDRAAYAINLGFSSTNMCERDLHGNIDLVGHNQDAQDQASEKKKRTSASRTHNTKILDKRRISVSQMLKTKNLDKRRT